MKRLLNIIMMAACCSMLLNACSSEEDIEQTPEHLLMGKWMLISDGPIDMSKSGSYILFPSTQNVIFYNGSTQQTLASQLEIDSDWEQKYDEESKKAYVCGHLLCNLYEKGDAESSLDKYSCRIEGNRLTLLPDMGYNYFRDPTMIFEREK